MKWSPKAAPPSVYDGTLITVANESWNSWAPLGALKSLGAIMGGTALAPQHVIEVKPRTYLHLDPPLSEQRRSSFTKSPTAVSKHNFFPFIGFEQTERRIDFDAEPHWKITSKSRPIRYASHNDAAIHALYAASLEKPYEAQLLDRDLDKSVLAYRRGKGSNIHFAKDLFDEIKERGNCFVICADVSGFFDNLDHSRLESAILRVLELQKLEKDWIKVFKRLTKYEWVNSRILRKVVPRSKQPHRLCSAEQFRKFVRPLVQVNNSDVGIPQGSPLSGLLANVYMLSFDKRMHNFATSFGGSYRRYSDDIAIVLPKGELLKSFEIALNVMLDGEGLRLNHKKTTVTQFKKEENTQEFFGETLQYLGFTYDGQKTLLRSSSLKRYYSNMKNSVRIAVRAASHAGYPKNEIKRRSLVGRFTHWGDSRNFVQYAYRASRIMASPEIKRQLRRHVKIFGSSFKANIEIYYRPGLTKPKRRTPTTAPS